MCCSEYLFCGTISICNSTYSLPLVNHLYDQSVVIINFVSIIIVIMIILMILITNELSRGITSCYSGCNWTLATLTLTQVTWTWIRGVGLVLSHFSDWSYEIILNSYLLIINLMLILSWPRLLTHSLQIKLNI